MQYKISIILPVFNVEEYIEEALESIIKQSIGLENLEVIMVDDHSTDHSGQIMDEYADKYDNFTAIHLPENSGGAGKPRNIGIEQASGEYLMFLDPDDSYAPDACQTLYDKISKEKVDMVFGTFSIDSKKKDKNLEYYEIKIDTIDEHKTFLKGSPTLWTRIYLREFILENNIRFPLIKAAQDSVFVAHTLLKAQGIIYINKVITNYTDYRVESVTNKKDVKTLCYRINAYSQIYELCKENGKEEYFTSYILRDKLINWMKHFVFSDLTDLEQKKALKLSSPLFRKCVEHGLTFPSLLESVVYEIINLKFDEAQKYLGKIKETQFKGRKKPSSPKYVNFNEVELLGEPQLKPKEDPAISESFQASKTQMSVEALVDEIEASVDAIESSADRIESILNDNIKKIHTLKKGIDELRTNFYMAEYENRRKPLSHRFPSLYILFKRRDGLKTSLRNIKAYKAIKKHDLLDIGYYLKNNQDVRLSGADPILHYIYHGYEEGRTPNPNFDADYYLENYNDVQQSKLNPLIHYALYGIEEGRIASTKTDKTPKLKKDKTNNTKRDITSNLKEEKVFKPGKKINSKKYDPNIARKPDRTNKHYDITIKAPPPYWSVAHNWGDYHMALALKKEFEKNNYQTDIQMHSEWEEEDNARVVFVIRGKFEYEPKPENFNIMWNISHPDEVSIEEYNKYDHVFIASNKWADEIKNKIDATVQPLLQCTDPEIFYPDHSSIYEHELLFVGNSRKVFRKILKDLLPTDHDLAIYGKEWNFLDKNLIHGDHIPNNQLKKAYSSCKILLNDHWEDMRMKGFISNRIFDGFASGAFIISDEINGAKEIFGNTLVTYSNSEELHQLIDYYLENEEERRDLANKGRDIVLLKDHTYENRVKQILEIIHKSELGS